MKAYKIILSLIFFFSYFVQISAAEIGGENNKKEKHILILHSYHQGLEWTDNITKGIESVLKKRNDINLIFEYLDTKRNHNEEYYNALLKLYEVKANQIPYEAIIVSDNFAYEFMKKNANDYYPGIPVLFCGVNNLDTTELADYPSFYGVKEQADHEGTISAIEHIFPKRDKILVISDITFTGKAIKKEIVRSAKNFKNLEFEYISDVTLDSLKQKIESLNSDWAIYLSVFNKDKNGNFISHRNGIEQIKQASNVPVFGSWDFYENKGLFGGKITRGFDQGQYVGELAEMILDNNLPLKLQQVSKIDCHYVFDFNEMSAFGIAEGALPKGSIIINRPKENDISLKVAIGLIAFLAIVVLILTIRLRIRRNKTLHLEKIVQERTSELIEANEDLKNIIEKKDKFFSILAHDLKNRIGSVYSAARLLNDEDISNQKEAVKEINRELLFVSDKTYGLLEDLLYWGMRQFDKRPPLQILTFSINELLKNITETYKVNQNRVSFTIDFQSNTKIDSDRQICNFVFRNLIQNAIKYSHVNGTVLLKIYEKNKDIYVAITDRGIGMSKEVIRSIENKQPIKKEGVMGQTGTGLGLPTVLDYLELLNAQLFIESSPEAGSTFTVKFSVNDKQL